MKKLIVSIAAVAMAMGVKAATVDWNIEYASNPWTADDMGTECTVYFFADSATLGGGDGQNFLTRESMLSQLEKGSFSADKATGAGTTAWSYGGIGISGVGNFNLGSDAETQNLVKGYLVLITEGDDNKQYAYITEMGSTAINDKGGSMTMAFGDLEGATKPINQTSSWYAVPEPTSGLLLLLGVAGLALRRRRA